MPRAVSAVLFAVLWTGAMPWARRPDGLGLAGHRLSRPACGRPEQVPR